MIAALSKTGNISAAARAAGVARRTHHLWMDRDPAYAAAVSDAFETSVEILEAAARQRALAGSDRLLVFLLRALRPEVYRDERTLVQSARLAVGDDALSILSDPDVAYALDRHHARKVEVNVLPEPK